ncbi:hypothetical protein WOLCODRAFT_152504 [Wolfiporia cocos MD-104 SS10]|uniref:Uncharacterized protein n=1 Tax=Wolfiporia cocos (strain MD-104) TaxID=742152 RepID=A0A2H3JKS7_WOLCO|nr:hypothetical protein WOLCODRAFT_152504 [Wolfiporia cocos MD-104 SS10]
MLCRRRPAACAPRDGRTLHAPAAPAADRHSHRFRPHCICYHRAPGQRTPLRTALLHILATSLTTDARDATTAARARGDDARPSTRACIDGVPWRHIRLVSQADGVTIAIRCVASSFSPRARSRCARGTFRTISASVASPQAFSLFSRLCGDSADVYETP